MSIKKILLEYGHTLQLHIVYSSICATVAELSSYNRDLRPASLSGPWLTCANDDKSWVSMNKKII